MTDETVGTSKLRICFTVDSLYAGGAERYVSLLAAGLDRDKFEAFVVVRNESGLDEWCGEFEPAGIPVTRLAMDMPFRPAHAIPVHRVLSRIKPHLVHINIPGPYDGQMGLLAPLARLAGTARVVVTEHLPRVERLWKRAMIKEQAYRFVDRVVTICRANVEPLIYRQRVGPGKISVVYNGIPASYGSNRDALRGSVRNELGLDDATSGIIFIGSLIERKGIGTLIDALAGLASDARAVADATAPQWRLFVVGEGEDRDLFVRRVEEAGLGDRVAFMGSRGAGDVERLLCGMDLLVVPSFMEGMPYVILEAMACSLPVVASSIDGIPEAIPDGVGGLLVEPGDPKALGAAISRFVGDGEYRARVGRGGRERFERVFTLDRHVAQMEQLYLGLLGADREIAGRSGDAGVEK